MSMRGGRFESAPDALFRELNDSLPVDVRLLAQDVRGSIDWAHALEEVGVLSRDERERLCAAL